MLNDDSKYILNYIIDNESKNVLENNWAQIYIDLELELPWFIDCAQCLLDITEEINYSFESVDDEDDNLWLVKRFGDSAILSLHQVGVVKFKASAYYRGHLYFKTRQDLENYLSKYPITERYYRQQCVDREGYKLPWKSEFNSFIILKRNY